MIRPLPLAHLWQRRIRGAVRTDPPEPVAVIPIHQMVPDVIPGLSCGLKEFGIVRELKRIQEEVKVVLCSGFSVEGRASTMLSRGASAFLQKPFEFHELQEVFSRVLMP